MNEIRSEQSKDKEIKHQDNEKCNFYNHHDLILQKILKDFFIIVSSLSTTNEGNIWTVGIILPVPFKQVNHMLWAKVLSIPRLNKQQKTNFLK